MQTSLLLHTFARRGKPMTFSELALALQGTGATVSELVAALSVVNVVLVAAGLTLALRLGVRI